MVVVTAPASGVAGTAARTLAGVDEHLPGAEDVPRVDEQAVRRPRAAMSREHLGPLELGVVGGDDHDVGVADRLLERLRRGGGVRVADRDVRELPLEQPDQLRRQRIALVVGVALERQPEHRHLARGQAADAGA